MNILALDLGTHAGWARNYGPLPWCGTRHLAKKGEIEKWSATRMLRRCDPRIERFYSFLTGLFSPPDLVVFEDVEFSTYTYQTQLWASLRAALWVAFDKRAVIECVPVQALKKFATGAGSATKEQMRAALVRESGPKWDGMDDNAIDAQWILRWAEKNLSRMIVA